MHKAWPEPKGIISELQFRFDLPLKLGKDDMDRNGISVETIRARREDKVGIQATEMAVPPAPQVVRAKPPQEIREVWRRNFGDPVELDSCEIDIFYSLAVQVDFEILVKPGDPLSHAALGAVALINEWGYDREARLAHEICSRSQPHIHRLAPALKNEEAPDA